MIDSELSFAQQIRHTADKNAFDDASRGRLMANVGGLRTSWHQLIMSSVNHVLLYRDVVWAHALSKSSAIATNLLRLKLLGALRVASAYCTVSDPAILVIAGVILERERQVIRDGQKGARKASSDAELRRHWIERGFLMFDDIRKGSRGGAVR